MNADPNNHAETFLQAATAARAASRVLATATAPTRNAALLAAADALDDDTAKILTANERDLTNATGTSAFQDRLRLTPARIAAMAAGLRAVAALPDPLDRVLAEWTRPNGLKIARIPQPIGVIGMIYESRPNVGADAAALALKSGNALLLRGGSESFFSSQAIAACIAAGLEAAGLPKTCVQTAPTTSRAYVAAMLAATGLIDLLIPRGGKPLVERVQREARIPVLAHGEGLNHTYVHQGADLAMARSIIANAKMRRTSVCGATEVLLLDDTIAETFLPAIVADLTALGCTFRADQAAHNILPTLPQARPTDFDTEWLDATLSIKIVKNLNEALAHIATHGSEHTDAIITEDQDAAEKFLANIASAVGLWNASTQFCDGGEFGFGGEIGIATGKLHARGPVGLEQLTTFRYLVRGHGQVRP
jgi:glutamate-5-semialdehyde dehydrogenase